MHAILTTLLGPRFPTGLLAVASLYYGWWEVTLGLQLLALTVGWGLLQEAVLSYGATDRTPRGSAVKLLILALIWGGGAWLTVRYLS